MIILALVVCGAIWGVVGMILSVPILIIAKIVLAEFPQTKPIAILISSRDSLEE